MNQRCSKRWVKTSKLTACRTALDLAASLSHPGNSANLHSAEDPRVLLEECDRGMQRRSPARQTSSFVDPSARFAPHPLPTRSNRTTRRAQSLANSPPAVDPADWPINCTRLQSTLFCPYPTGEWVCWSGRPVEPQAAPGPAGSRALYVRI